jgi:hypothetical protein
MAHVATKCAASGLVSIRNMILNDNIAWKPDAERVYGVVAGGTGQLSASGFQVLKLSINGAPQLVYTFSSLEKRLCEPWA